MRFKRKIFLILAVVLVVFLAWIWRVIWVNTHAVQISEEHFKVGDTVPIGNNYNDVRDGDNSVNYTVSVLEAVRESPREYLEQAGAEVPDLYKTNNHKSVVKVKLRIENTGDDQGGINIFGMQLVVPDKNAYLIADAEGESSLWGLTGVAASYTFSLKPHSSIEIDVPYVLNEGSQGLEADLKPGTYYLRVTALPLRQLIDVPIS